MQWYNTHRQTLQEWPDQVPMALQPVPLGFRVDAAFHLTVGQGLPKSSEGLPEIGKCLSEGTEAIAKFLEAINMAISMSWGRMINRSELADETEKNLSQAGWAHLALNPFVAFFDKTLPALLLPAIAGTCGGHKLVAAGDVAGRRGGKGGGDGTVEVLTPGLQGQCQGRLGGGVGGLGVARQQVARRGKGLGQGQQVNTVAVLTKWGFEGDAS